MSVESYIKAMAKAGISRGQFETNFQAWDASNVSSLHEKAYDEDVGLTINKPKLEEDLSYLNSKFWQKSQAHGFQGGVKSSAKARRKAMARPNPCTAMVKWVKQVVWKPAGA